MATKVKRARTKKTASKKASATRPGARRQPETLRLRKIAPSFTATDLQRSIAFYRDVLGFVTGEEWREEGALARGAIHAAAGAILPGPHDVPKGRDPQEQPATPAG